MSKFLPYKILSIEDLPNEEWRKIPDLAGNFYASNLGRIKSLEFDVMINGICHTVPEFIIRQYKDKNGYLVSGVVNKRSSHRLIASAFLGNFFSLPVVNHINGNRDENWISNLEMCTYRGNSAHMKARKNNGGESISLREISMELRKKQFRKELRPLIPMRVINYAICVFFSFLFYVQMQNIFHIGLWERVFHIFLYLFFVVHYETSMQRSYLIAVKKAVDYHI